ncbi:ABC transporter substrate-binding protein [Protofrankia coriariae]|uniref:ABC transporter substrate-binding protein n=1 Tax=Protofrankia coriariae TaxID=1562887 RepID=UPI001910CEE1|nr:ABC transporter substrate-binding protein [Protofrankia coriariae]
MPIRSLYSASTTHLPLLTDLGRAEVLTGVANAASVVDAGIRGRIADGKVVEYAGGGQIDVEKVVTAQPDVLMTGGTDTPQYPAIRRAGGTVLANAEWLEGDPLGRAEWIKVMAALTGDEEKAAKVFEQITTDYTAIAARARAAGGPPRCGSCPGRCTRAPGTCPRAAATSANSSRTPGPSTRGPTAGTPAAWS